MNITSATVWSEHFLTTIILPNSAKLWPISTIFLIWFSTRFSFIQHISCLLPLWKLKRVSHHTSKKGTLDCEIAVTICGATRSSSKTLKQKQHGASKTTKSTGLVVHILQQIISANNYLNIFSCKMQWKPHGSGSKVWKLGNIPKVIFLDITQF